MMKTIGILGGISSGKSFASRYLASLGAGIIEADKIAHEVLEYDEIIQQMQYRWRNKLYNEYYNRYDPLVNSIGNLDRWKIARLAFENKEELKFLQDITHPLIMAEIKKRYERFIPDYIPAVIFDAPLLLETQLHNMCTDLWFIDAPIEDRIKRSKLSEKELKIRESFQISLKLKKSMATASITNGCDRDGESFKAKLKMYYEKVIKPRDCEAVDSKAPVELQTELN